MRECRMAALGRPVFPLVLSVAIFPIQIGNQNPDTRRPRAAILRAYAQLFVDTDFNTSDVLLPPNPNELLTATLTCWLRG